MSTSYDLNVIIALRDDVPDLVSDLDHLIQPIDWNSSDSWTPASKHPFILYGPMHLGWEGHFEQGPVLGPCLLHEIGDRLAEIERTERRGNQLLLSCSLSNLQRQDTVGDDADPSAPEIVLPMTRLELLLDFLTQLSADPIGRVVGSFTSETYLYPGAVIRGPNSLGVSLSSERVDLWEPGWSARPSPIITVRGDLPASCYRHTDGGFVEFNESEIRRYVSSRDLTLAPA